MADRKRKNELLKKLILSNEVPLKEIMLKYRSSEEEVINVIDEINNHFKSDIILFDQHIVHMTEQSKVFAYQYYCRHDNTLFESHDHNERYHLIILEILIKPEYSSLKGLADRCLVSKNTTLNDLKAVKKLLCERELNIEYTRKNGYTLSGSEFSKRNLLAATIKDILKIPAGRLLLEDKGYVTESEIYLLRKRLEKVENRIGIKLTDEQWDELPYILQFIVKRASIITKPWSFRIEKYDIKNTVEFPVIKNMFWDYQTLNDTDLLYISLHIIASNRVESALHISSSEEISESTERFVNNIESHLAIRIVKRTELKEKIILHMSPAIYRSLMGFQITNPLADGFIEQYDQIYHIVQKSVTPFENILQQKLSKEEVVYLSMIVLSWVSRTEQSDSIFKAVVLCQSGISISKLLLVTLRSLFPEIHFIGTYSIRQFQETEKEVDFIFTTVPFESTVPTFLVPSILDKTTKSNLKSQLNMEMYGDNQRMSKNIFHSIKHFISEQNHEVVEEKIKNLLQNVDTRTTIDDNEKQNHFIFSANHISIIEEKVCWEDVVDISMAPLLYRGSITTHYATETERLFYKDFNSMLIAPEVYLPHARPLDGAKETDFQIMIFKNSVVMPDEKRLNLVVSLSPDANNAHVPTLIKLNSLFLNQEIREQIMNETNIFTVQQLLNKEGDVTR
ncbi:PRD domain-containing protein [Salibacterium salarium]|uniref:Ascorbate-specific PTS system EIIA component n=1 Tax=Salibacterium salarium TaxID=284579 RepID=A0A3R9PMA2_9BACI|nr:BglG family transcription antiterminator [Salibacterium salarium]RSL33946.1 PRD domain-containing protein [Salibacterium salarium]